jgi:signal peptidase I
MEPAFFKGDLLFLSNRITQDDPLRVGDVVVFNVDGRDIPIVHRIIRLHKKYALIFVLCSFQLILVRLD